MSGASIKNAKREWESGERSAMGGDKDAVELYQQWYRSEHPNFERLSKEEVSAIIDFCGR